MPRLTRAERLKYLFLTYLWRSDDCPPKTGPYLDYPYFEPTGLQQIRNFWKRTVSLMKAGRAPREIGIYIHWPYCPSQCNFCYCSMKVPSSKSEMSSYAAMLRSEMDALKDVFEGVSFNSIWIGGGTPTFISDEDLDALLRHLRSSFQIEPGAQFYVESSPATLTPEKIRILIKHGVNRVTLGIQSMEDQVVSRVNRVGQTRRKIEEIWRHLSELPLIKDVDLVMGLEGQTRLSFIEDLIWAIRSQSDVIHIYGFDPKPHTLFSMSGKKFANEEWENLSGMMDVAERILKRARYRQPVWIAGTDRLEPLEEKQDGSLRKIGASVLGFGSSAKSHAFGGAWYQRRSIESEASPLNPASGYYFFESGLEDEMEHYAVRHLSRFHFISRPDFKRNFGKDILEEPRLARNLADLEETGVIRIRLDRIEWTSADLLTRQLVLRHLYSPRLVSALLTAYKKEYQDFLATYSSSQIEWEKKIRDKINIVSLERIYFSEKADRRLATEELSHALS